jgi:ribonucleotide reductase alpha subunit
MANYYIHGQQLQIVDNAKYVGLTISKNLSWNNHINNITKKANSTPVEVLYCCSTGSMVVVVGDESGSSALDALYFIDVGLSMWIPHSRGIFK